MNERIQKLAEQSGAGWDDKYHWYVGNDTLKKFAQLIVTECINTVNKRYMGDNNREDFEVRRCVDDLKKHFGVEE